MTNHSPKTRSTVKLRSDKRPKRIAGLASHLIPVVVLVVGMMWWMTSLNRAQAQTQNVYQNGQLRQGGQFGGQFQGNQYGAAGQPQYSATPAQPQFRTAMQPGGNLQSTGGIPAMPAGGAATEAIGGDIAADGAESVDASWFHTPALVTKVMSGGWLMLPLALCSLVVLTLSFERMIALRRGRVIPRPFVRRFTECVEDGVLSYDEATELCKEFDCPVSEVFRAALRRWGRPMFEIEQAVMDAGERVADGLRKYLRLFSAVSNVSPLLGLLGTVLGMIEAFEALSSSDASAPPDMLASGISEALITTAAGLSVAIPAYLAYVYFSARADKYLVEIDALCQQVVESISAEGMSGTTTSRGTRRQKRAA
ncbi:MAG: MotA/TolQ/ExbB proton channel family protein [Planctomycetales bacterium]|nr:MotA/TolQ/ExbB proton channel family protein [Planctomycetales bacterium]